MTEQTSPIPDLMPSGETLAVEVIAALIGEGYTSSLLKLPRPVLNEVGRQLVLEKPTSEALEEWLAEKGHAVPDRNIRRFARRFREKYATVVGKHAITRALAEQARDGVLTDFNRKLIQQVISHKLLTTAPEDMDPAELATFIRGIRLEDMREHDTESLAIARDQAEARAAKAEGDLKIAKADADRRERKLESDLKLSEKRSAQIEARLTQAQQRFDAEMKTLASKKSGKSQITDEDIAHARRLVFGR